MVRIKPPRVVASILAVAGLLTIPALALAGNGPTVYYASELAKKTRCTNTGISVPTGKVTLFVYAVEGMHPSKAALSCTRAIAVGRAGRKYISSNLRASYGKTFSVQGTTYTVEEFVFVAASGPAPAFVGAGTVVAAQYASGR